MSSRIRAVPAATPATPPTRVELLRQLADNAREAAELLEQLARLEPADDELVDVLSAVPAPKRTLMSACRQGRIAGAVKVGRRWLASRAAIDAYLRQRGPRAVPNVADDLGALRRRLASSR